MHVATRRVHIAGLTPFPNERWMTQIARNLTMADVGFLVDHRYLIHDRDGNYCPAFDSTLTDGGVTPVQLPPRSPNLNAHVERWVRSVKDECLSKLILFGKPALRTALRAYTEHFHGERNHQGKDNLLFHLVRHLIEAVDQVRRDEVREKGPAHKALMYKTRFIWLKNPWNLTESQAARLVTGLLALNPVHRPVRASGAHRRPHR